MKTKYRIKHKIIGILLIIIILVNILNISRENLDNETLEIIAG